MRAEEIIKELNNYKTVYWRGLFIDPNLSTPDLIATVKSCSPIITNVEVVTRLPGRKTDVCDLKLTHNSDEEIDHRKWLQGLGVILKSKLEKHKI